MNDHDKFRLVLMIVDRAVKNCVILASNAIDQVAAVSDDDSGVSAHLVDEPLFVGVGRLLLLLEQPPLVVHGDVILLCTGDRIMILNHCQSVIECETGLLNFLRLLLSRILIKKQFGEHILL